MIVSVLSSDIEAALAERNSGNTDVNPLLLALDRATNHDEDFENVRWVASKMSVFNEKSYLANEPMPQLYLVSDANAQSAGGGTDFFVLPLEAQQFMDDWGAKQPVRPFDFEIPLVVDPQPHTTERIHGLSDDMFEGLRQYAHRFIQEANRDIDLDMLRRGLNRMAVEANREIDLDPILDPVKKAPRA